MSASGLQVSLQVQTQMMRGTSCTAIWILAGNSSSFIVEVRQRAVDERITAVCVGGYSTCYDRDLCRRSVLQVTAVVLANSLSETFTPLRVRSPASVVLLRVGFADVHQHHKAAEGIQR